MMKTRVAIALAGFVFTSLFFINLCNLVFACGCASLWAGADVHCNVHHAGGLHCPVCNHGVFGYAITFIAIVIPQLTVAFWMKRGPWIWRLAVVLALFPLVGAIVMAAAGWLDGYPLKHARL